MSTRSVIARAGKIEGEFRGVYVHWDGSPHSRGPSLWKIVHEEFKGDLKVALASLIDKHPAGFSSLETRSCYCHPRRSKDAEFRKRKPEPANIFTHEHVVSGTDIEWLFVFDEENNRLCVRDVADGAETLIELANPNPNWIEAECGENFERCRHYAWFHKLLPQTSNLSAQTWLGRRPLQFRDAVAFIIDGKRYAATVNGGNASYLGRNIRQELPPNTWIATVVARNHRRLDVPVAVLVNRDYVPFSGVTWVMPPTSLNPNETFVSGDVS
jgi:hypothetical protein